MSGMVGIETSSATGSVAVTRGTAVFERTIATPREQTDLLLPIIAELLAEAGLRLRELDAVVFGRGPGSFTGLRIAAAAAQGLGLAAELPVVGVSSLAAIAQRAHAEHGGGRVLVAVDARMGEVYWAGFELRAGLATLVGTERIGPPATVETPPGWRGYAAVGDAFRRYAAELGPFADGAERRDADTFPRARDLLPLARADLLAGRAVPPAAARPTYLRDDSAWRRS